MPFGLAIAAAALLAVSSPGVVLGWDNYSFSAASENEMLTLINQARAAHGLPAYAEKAVLTDVARWRSKDMWDRDYFSHNIPNPPGGNVFDELQRRDVCYTARRREHRRQQLPGRRRHADDVQRLDGLVRPPRPDPERRLHPHRDRRLQGQRLGLPEALLDRGLHQEVPEPRSGPRPDPEADAEAHAQADAEAGPDTEATQARPDARRRA